MPTIEPQDDTFALRQEVQAELDRRWQDQFARQIEFYGGVDGWHQACHRARLLDPNHQAARIIKRLLRDSRLSSYDRERLAVDPELEAYFDPVIQGDTGAQLEERNRIADVLRDAARDASHYVDRYPALAVDAVRQLIPTWRYWGSILLDAGYKTGHATSALPRAVPSPPQATADASSIS